MQAAMKPQILSPQTSPQRGRGSGHPPGHEEDEGEEVNKKTLLSKLEELYGVKEVIDGFPTQQACIDWSNKVAPLLKFNQQSHKPFHVWGRIVASIIEHQVFDRIIDYLKLHVFFTEVALMAAEESVDYF